MKKTMGLIVTLISLQTSAQAIKSECALIFNNRPRTQLVYGSDVLKIVKLLLEQYPEKNFFMDKTSHPEDVRLTNSSVGRERALDYEEQKHDYFQIKISNEFSIPQNVTARLVYDLSPERKRLAGPAKTLEIHTHYYDGFEIVNTHAGPIQLAYVGRKSTDGRPESATYEGNIVYTNGRKALVTAQYLKGKKQLHVQIE